LTNSCIQNLAGKLLFALRLAARAGPNSTFTPTLSRQAGLQKAAVREHNALQGKGSIRRPGLQDKVFGPGLFLKVETQVGIEQRQDMGRAFDNGDVDSSAMKQDRPQPTHRWGHRARQQYDGEFSSGRH
jgi:hypothetical protein